jgi:hypothetical protein
MIDRPIITLDKFTDFNDKQTKKINSMIMTQYNKFVDKTFQKQENEEKSKTAVIAESGRLSNCSSFEYNGTGFATFQLITLGMVIGEEYPMIQVNHNINKIICYGGSSYEDLFDDITDWGYFYAKGNIIYFKLTTDFETLLFPYCNITWTY